MSGWFELFQLPLESQKRFESLTATLMWTETDRYGVTSFASFSVEVNPRRTV
jgi:hypothetical protein